MSDSFPPGLVFDDAGNATLEPGTDLTIGDYGIGGLNPRVLTLTGDFDASQSNDSTVDLIEAGALFQVDGNVTLTGTNVQFEDYEGASLKVGGALTLAPSSGSILISSVIIALDSSPDAVDRTSTIDLARGTVTVDTAVVNLGTTGSPTPAVLQLGVAGDNTTIFLYESTFRATAPWTIRGRYSRAIRPSR